MIVNIDKSLPLTSIPLNVTVLPFQLFIFDVFMLITALTPINKKLHKKPA